MHTRVISLLAAAVAVSGVALTVSIPAASAQKANAAPYCEYTEYTQYGEYCEPEVTTANGTTTIQVSPTQTITGSPGAASSSSTTLPKGQPSVVDLSHLAVGVKFVTKSGLVLEVLSRAADGTMTMSFGGIAVAGIPADAVITVLADRSASITWASGPSAHIAQEVPRAVAFHTIAATGEQVVVLPKGKSSNTVSYSLTKGASFGATTTWKQIAKSFTVESLVAKSATTSKLSKVAFTLSANRARTAVTIKLAKSQRSFVVKFNVGKLQYSAAEKTYILKHKLTTLSSKLTVKAHAGTTSSLDVFAFGYPI